MATGWRMHAKRGLDVTIALLLAVLLSPLLAVIAAVIRVAMGRPIFFRQVRIGMGERPFTLIKFRTMRAPSPGEDELTTDADRISRIGRLLRITSLDELPTLINVLRGDMSLVGPRPLLPEYLPLYTQEERRRHLVRPGITGLAQVSGRQDLTFRQRFAFDVQYVDQMSLRNDVRILWQTLRAVLASDGVRTGQSFDEVDDIGASEAVARRHEASS